jgi:hypothetical protein
VVLVAVAVVVAVLLISQIHGPAAKTAGGTPSAKAEHPTTTTSTTVALVDPKHIKLQVLNGLINGSLSSEFSAKLHRQYGYVTLAPNNTTKLDRTSEIYIVTSGYLPEAQVLAKEVGLPTSAIDPSVPPPTTAPLPAASLTGADLILVVGSSLASKA